MHFETVHFMVPEILDSEILKSEPLKQNLVAQFQDAYQNAQDCKIFRLIQVSFQNISDKIHRTYAYGQMALAF